VIDDDAETAIVQEVQHILTLSQPTIHSSLADTGMGDWLEIEKANSDDTAQQQERFKGRSRAMERNMANILTARTCRAQRYVVQSHTDAFCRTSGSAKMVVESKSCAECSNGEERELPR
jgi:hypothetical protein